VFQVVKNSAKPLGDQLVEDVGRAIESGRLPEGARLPSVRQLARRASVSAYTVATAFERLHARGLIESRPGSGHFVARRRRQQVTAAVELGPPPNVNPALDFARRTLDQSTITVPAGSGFLPASWFADAIPPSTLSKFKNSGAAAMPPPVQGDHLLRELLVERMHLSGVPATARNVMVTFGASQAFDLIARSLLSPGDTVLVDDPGYFVLTTQLKAYRLNLVPVPKCAEGSDLDALEELATLHQPRMFFTQTLLHNPTGITASAANCHGILKLADKYNFLIAEDHVYTDLAPPHLVSLAQIDELRRVIYVGSFTKVLCPGIRIGFVAAPEALMPQLLDAKILSVLSGSALDEFVVREVLASGKYRKHVEHLRDRITKARAITSVLLRDAGLRVDSPAHGGLFLWCQLPAAVDMDHLLAEARKAGILLALGSMFSLTARSDSYLRFNAVYGSDPSLIRVLTTCCRAPA
jgi:DNA-binding transcriptional MocR family regulator